MLGNPTAAEAVSLSGTPTQATAPQAHPSSPRPRSIPVPSTQNLPPHLYDLVW